MNRTLEKKILELAVSRGYLELGLLKSIERRLSESETIVEESEWGAHIDCLLREGRFDQALLQQLKQEVTATNFNKEDHVDTILHSHAQHHSLSEIKKGGQLLEELAGWEKYRLVSLLGSGGMGSVYLAEDLQLSRKLALKFLHFQRDSSSLRFTQEARAQARIQHPNVCSVYEVGEVKGRSYIAMEYVEGKSLKDLHESLNLEQKVYIVRVCAEALQAAHSFGIIHRDIKPANIMVERKSDGSLRPVLMDFGLARETNTKEGLTETGTVLGTPAYMSPEQARGDKLLDRRTDIYSLGATLYEMVTNCTPFAGETLMSVLMSVVKDEPQPPRKLVPELPSDLEAIILKCLEKDRNHRYDSAAALAADLQRFLDGKPIEAMQNTFRYRLGKFAHRHKNILILASIVFLAFSIASGWAVRAELHARQQLEIAQQFAVQINEIDFLLQRAYLLPLHNIRPEREMVARRVSEIESNITALGEVAYSPGYYALAKGYYILGQDQKALEYLLKARSNGNNDPEIDYYLGLVQSSIYKDKLMQASNLSRKEEREALSEALKKEFIPQIQQSLSRYLQSGDKRQSVDYVQGMLLFYQNHLDAALGSFDRVIEKYPWFYKAYLAKAEVIKRKQEEAALKGQYEDSFQHYRKALEVLSMAEAIGRSDPEVYTAQLQAFQKYFKASKYRKALDPETYKSTVAIYEKAIKADPQDSEARVAMAHICSNYAIMVFESGEDPTEYHKFALQILGEVNNNRDAEVLKAAGQIHLIIVDYNYYKGANILEEFEKVANYFKKALELDPNDSSTYNDLGYLYITRYDYEVKKGMDVTESFQKAVYYLKRSLDLRPNFAITMNNLGYIHEREATRLSKADQDPKAMFDAAREYYRRSLELNPNSVTAVSNLGILLVRIAEYNISRGQDPEQYLKEAEEVFLKTLPTQYSNAYNNISYLYRIKAQIEMWQGRSPLHYLEKAIENAAKSVEISPTYSVGWSNLGHFYILRGEYELEHGRIDREAVKEARSSLERALKETPDSFIAMHRLARLELLLARQAIVLKENPERYFDRAVELLEKSLSLNSKHLDSYLLGIEICYKRGLWLYGKRRSAQAEWKRAVEMLAKAKTLTYENSDILTAEAEVLYLQSLQEPQIRKSAIETLVRATSMNSWMKRRNDLLLAEMSR